ncbi:DUF3696 domain-containing protein [Hymenobacter sp. B81]|uniref:AAA family ATPase n=1 Tax=Hymenobacter sp. B81 TaxID=3344878 RepID=UPI0037DD6FEE
MITNLTLENFKGFGKLSDLQIKPITILCGTNSCGKSSILQSLLLLKQTVESKNPHQNVILNGRFVHLGNFDNIIHKKDIDKPVKISFAINIKKEEIRKVNRGQMPLTYTLKHLCPVGNSRDNDFYISISFTLKSGKSIRNTSTIKSIDVESMQINVSAKNTDGEITQSSIKMTRIEENQYTLLWQNIPRNSYSSRLKQETSHGECTAKIAFANLIPVMIDTNRQTPVIEFAFYRIRNLLQAIFFNYQYIGPLREEPSRRYIYENEYTEVGIKGENAAFIYFEEQDKQIRNHYFFDHKTEKFAINEKVSLGKAVRSWLDLMGIKSFTPEIQEGIIELKLNSSSSSKTQVNIADVGFGVSQIFPIILEGIRMPKGGTLLLEQPEIHLHPKLQMQMADYFISLALSGKSVIAETHSDHIVNRLVRRIVEDEEYSLLKLIKIYFIKPSKRGSTAEEIQIDERRGVINWPEDFFDQTASEQEKIIRAGIKKIKKSNSL